MLLHESSREFIFAQKRNRLHIRLQYLSKTPVDINLYSWNRFYTDDVLYKKMCCVGHDASRYYYEIELEFEAAAQYLQYYFEVHTNDGAIYWSRHGGEQSRPKYFFEYLSTAELDNLDPPEWAQGSIWYQIFPERFFNANPNNDPPGAEAWGAPPNRENHFGGDLAGIREKIPYLQKLGIDVLYMTPIFASPSNHKYDTTNYFEIDPSFGTTQDLISLVKDCHSQGIKVILDGVFNHIGYSSKQFQDVIKNGSASEFADWFYVENYPIQTEPLNYECVGYYKWMPKLRYKTRAVRDYILSIGRYWIEVADIDGWRLDVADEVDFTFWQEFRQEIKRVKPDAFLLGETWKDGRDMVRGDQMDSVMNYLFRDAVLDFFARQEIDASIFEQRISQMLYGYSNPVRPVLYNPLGSHDTARALTECKDDLNKLKLMVAFQMTFPGMPVIYYGDEIAMYGENDPDCRKTMEWETANKELCDYYKDLTNLRHQVPSLQFGDIKFIYSNESVTAYSRTYKFETTYIVINNASQECTVNIPLFEGATNITNLQSAQQFQLAGKLIPVHSQLTDNSLWVYEKTFQVTLPAFSFGIITTYNETQNE